MAKNRLGAQATTGRRFRSQWLKPGTRHWYKNQSARKMRRLSKQDPENAPKKYRFFGWAD